MSRFPGASPTGRATSRPRSRTAWACPRIGPHPACDAARPSLHAGKAGPRRRRGGARFVGKPRRSDFEGGWSLSLWGRHRENGSWQDRPGHPRVLIKHVDSKRALKGLGSVEGSYLDPRDLVWEEEEAGSFKGHLLDLRTLAFALTDRGHTLESACEAFGVPYTKREV